MSDPKTKLDIPEGSPPETPTKEAYPSRRNPVLIVLAAVLLLGAVVFVVTVPLVRGDYKFRSSSSSASSLDSPVEGTPTEDNPPLTNTEDPSTNTPDTEDPPTETPFQNTVVDSGLPYFSENITKGYETEEEFEDALLHAARWLVRSTLRDSQAGQTFNKGLHEQDFAREDRPLEMTTTEGAAESAAADDSSGQETAGYGTNNQEQGVDEADVVKSDGTYVYAAYGDYIIVFDNEGTRVADVSMPSIETPTIDDPVDQPKESMEPLEMETLTSTSSSPGATTSSRASGGNRKARRKTSSTIIGDYWWNPKPNIQSLMLVGDYLVAFVSGYGHSLQQTQSLTSMPILYDYLNTQIRMYDISSIATGDVSFVGKTDVHGRYIDARAVGNNIHLSTMSSVDTWSTLKAPFYDTVYETDAELEAAVEKATADFVSRLNEDLSAQGDIPTMLQINSWQTTKTIDGRLVEEVMTGVTVMDNLVHVTSFSVDGTSDEGELLASSSAFFSPGYASQMYGTADMIILTTEAWDWNAGLENSEQTTYLLGLELDGANTNFVSVGSVSGYLLNSYALDIYGDDLRVATTIRRNNWWWGGGMIEPAIDTLVLSVEEATTTTEIVEEESNTENWIIVLSIQGDGAGTMTLKGEEQIGLVNEVITSVRFYDEVAYAVTFERTDPFYVLDMSVPTAVGELKLNGFSSYLHSMNADHSLMLAVGQDATDEGVPIGLMLTVFDATDKANPTVSVSVTIEESDQAHSSSSAQWDYKAFRFYNGKLIVPVDIWHYGTWEGQVYIPPTEENFLGFKVFDVTENSIEEAYSIDHSTVGSGCHYCSGWMSPRSVVLDDTLMTIRDGTVVASSFETDPGAFLWDMNLSVKGEEQCCW